MEPRSQRSSVRGKSGSVPSLLPWGQASPPSRSRRLRAPPSKRLRPQPSNSPFALLKRSNPESWSSSLRSLPDKLPSPGLHASRRRCQSPSGPSPGTTETLVAFPKKEALCCQSMSEPRIDRLTASQRDALAAELAELEGPKRTAAIEAIKTAREHGDLSENFEYHAAKDEQGLLEARIRTLRNRLDHSVLVEESELVPDKVGVGSIVEIEDDE